MEPKLQNPGHYQDPAGLVGVLNELQAIRNELVSNTAVPNKWIKKIHPDFADSGRNLLHYLALRRQDLRPLQLRLAALGLSSLGRAESHVLATIDAVIKVLHHLCGLPYQQPQEYPDMDFATGKKLLVQNTNALLGPARSGRDVRIMVTMPSEAADNYGLVHALLNQGMDCMRINCAHDDAVAWAQMIRHLKKASDALGRDCKIVMDLAGPKLRTGPVEPGPSVVKCKPQRDAIGRVTAPSRIWLTSKTAPQPPPTDADACLQVDGKWLSNIKKGERLRLTDARGSKRTATVTEVAKSGCWAEASKTIYFVQGMVLRHQRNEIPKDTTVGELPPTESFITLNRGDVLIITRDSNPGRPAGINSRGKIISPAHIGCSIPEVFDDVKPGEAIWFDDGKIGGIIEHVGSEKVHVRITYARPLGGRLRSDKGINLPESTLKLPALSDKDIEDLAFVAQHADAVALSFANSAKDVELLEKHLSKLTSNQPAILLKIETQRGFNCLPEMLLTAMRSPRCGVMIARGDLAVECGFERLAEVQEEILWICEAAHVPVIWATQVLETLAKKGMPSRAEISDAAMGHRAECVMLNKGPHMVNAVKVLDNILRRMHAHQAKKHSMLRELRLAHTLPPDLEMEADAIMDPE